MQLTFSQFVYVTGQNITNNFSISTRGNFDLVTGELIPLHNSTDYLYYNGISGNTVNSTQDEIICPSQKEIAIYIHGVWTDEASANEQVNRTAMSLQTNNNTIPLIGFSWDSNTPYSEEGWKNVKSIAANNGPKLAQFILDFKNKCED